MKTLLHLSLFVTLLLTGCVTQQGKKWQRTIHLKTESPLDQVAEIGGTARFAVSSKHRDGVIYQWLHGNEVIANATSNVLAISSITTNNAGYYMCVAYRGLDMQVSEPMQLITLERVAGGTSAILGARTPPGLGGNVLFQGQTAGRNVRGAVAPKRQDRDNYGSGERAEVSSGGGNAPVFTSGMVSAGQLTLLMQIDIPGLPPIISTSTGSGCPNPYSGYVRYTAGWYPKTTTSPGAPPPIPWKVTALWAPCSAIIVDDRYRSACGATSDFDITAWAPIPTRLHRFVAYFPPGSPPNPNTTYLLHLTGF